MHHKHDKTAMWTGTIGLIICLGVGYALWGSALLLSALGAVGLFFVALSAIHFLTRGK